MNRSKKQGAIAVLFVALLGFVAIRGSGQGGRDGTLSDLWNRLTGRSTPIESVNDSQKLERYGFHLVDRAQESGLTFRHRPATLDAKLEHIMPLVNPMGAGVTVLDYDRDGKLDLYFTTSDAGGQNCLYRNRGDGTFVETAGPMGVADLNQPGTGACMGSVAADYDSDGYPDLFVYKWGRSELFHNENGKRFERVTDTAGLPNWINANAACWLDYDRDGRLDLFIAGYWRDDIDLWNLKTTEIMPESFEFAKNGGHKYLLRNVGEGRFEDVTETAGIGSTRWTLGIVASDLDGNGYPDLVLANDYGVSEVYLNRDGNRFDEVGYESGIGVTPKSGMSVSLGDALNEGRQALYVTNITEPGNLVQGNNLWVQSEEASGSVPRYVNQAGSLNIERGGWSWGARFGDLNNDGWLDLYLTNGYVSASPGKSYWYDYGKIAGGLKGLIGDARFWPPIGDQSLAGFQQKCVWLNKGGDFTDVAAAIGTVDRYDGRAVVFADIENRGVLDVVIANQNGPALLYRNTVAPGRDWVQLELTGGARPGQESGWSNRDAVGADVILTWRQGKETSSRQQIQTVTAGDAYASQGMSRLHFGLGPEAVIEQASIVWPSGRTQVLKSLKTGVLHQIAERDAEDPSP